MKKIGLWDDDVDDDEVIQFPLAEKSKKDNNKLSNQPTKDRLGKSVKNHNLWEEPELEKVSNDQFFEESKYRLLYEEECNRRRSLEALVMKLKAELSDLKASLGTHPIGKVNFNGSNQLNDTNSKEMDVFLFGNNVVSNKIPILQRKIKHDLFNSDDDDSLEHELFGNKSNPAISIKKSLVSNNVDSENIFLDTKLDNSDLISSDTSSLISSLWSKDSTSHLNTKTTLSKKKYSSDNLYSEESELEIEFDGLGHSMTSNTKAKDGTDTVHLHDSNNVEWEQLALEERARKSKLRQLQQSNRLKDNKSKRLNLRRSHLPNNNNNNKPANTNIDIVTSSSIAKQQAQHQVSDNINPSNLVHNHSNGHINVNKNNNSNNDSDSSDDWDDNLPNPNPNPDLNTESTEDEIEAPQVVDEVEIEKRVIAWARGNTNMALLLQTVGQVFHGPLPDLGQDWNTIQSRSPADIRKAFLKIVRFCHPDKQGNGVSPVVKIEAEKVFAVLSDAYTNYKNEMS